MTSYLTGEDVEEIDKEVMDDILEQIEEEQKEWFKNGADALPGSKRNTATRLQFYESSTLTAERLFILDEDYRSKMEEGIYPPLAETVWYVLSGAQKVAGPFVDEQTAAEMAMQMGLWQPMTLDPMTAQPLPPPIGQAPSFWAQLMQYGEFPDGWSLMKSHCRDFRNLLEQLGRRIEGNGQVGDR